MQNSFTLLFRCRRKGKFYDKSGTLVELAMDGWAAEKIGGRK